MNTEPICYIFGAAPMDHAPKPPRPGDFVIAADGGYVHLQRLGISPDLLLGDLDSLEEANCPLPAPEIPLERWPKEKDDTDMQLGVEAGLRRGFRRFFLYGGTGGRIDHTLANLHTLAYLALHGGIGFLFGGGRTLCMAAPGGICFDAEMQGILSIFAWGGSAQNVTLRGLKYPLENQSLHPDRALGVSNAFLGCEAWVEHQKGLLLLCWEGDRIPKISPRIDIKDPDRKAL